MKLKSAISLSFLLTALAAQAKGLYYIPNEVEETLPLEWSVGINAIYDDNTTPTVAGPDDETFSLNPYVGLNFSSATPQSTWEVYAKLGVIYYLDEPVAAGSDDTYTQSRIGVNFTHQFDERLNFASRNLIAYELEPDYALGVATDRQSSEYLYVDLDNSVGYRWTERLGTYTGIKYTMLQYDSIANADRATWMVYNQFRYQLSPQTTATASYRHAETSGAQNASDSTDDYFLVGIEHRLSPTSIIIADAGAQLHSVDQAGGTDSTNPYLQVTFSTRVNEQLTVSAFARYGNEVYGTVQSIPGLVEYDNRVALRVGTTATYQVSEDLSLNSSVNVVTGSYQDGRTIPGGLGVADRNDTVINASIGASLRLTEYLTGSLSYNFTGSNSDFTNQTYERNIISLGLAAEF